MGKASEKVMREVAADMAMVAAHDVQEEYTAGGVRVHALRGVDLSIARCEMVAVMDPPAAGRRCSSTAYE